jgi:mRNA-degrading endonuclease RelE of RelBE toxin-antitoxin system
MYEIVYAEGAADDLKALPAGVRSRVLDALEEQLAREPMRRTRNR